jgi:hypothetical protein
MLTRHKKTVLTNPHFIMGKEHITKMCITAKDSHAAKGLEWPGKR